MDTLMLLQQIFEVCIVPLLGILTAFLIQYINTKKAEISTNVDNKLADKYINMLADTITKCVIATNQTYVDSLKDKEVFTVEAQKEAYQKTMDAVMAILSDEAKTYLTNTFGDLETYLQTQIEATVSANKKAPTTTE